MYTSKTTTQTGRTGIMSRPLQDGVVHQVMRVDGGVLGNYTSAGLAKKVSDELNAFEANPPMFGDLEAIFLEIASQKDEEDLSSAPGSERSSPSSH